MHLGMDRSLNFNAEKKIARKQAILGFSSMTYQYDHPGLFRCIREHMPNHDPITSDQTKMFPKLMEDN
jgi:hypothetical protein